MQRSLTLNLNLDLFTLFGVIFVFRLVLYVFLLSKYLFIFISSALKLRTSRSAGIAAFEMEYGHWVEEQNRLICELRTALHAHISDVELRMLVDSGMSHYFDLFRMKATAAKADVFYVMSGMWKTSAERFFLWIGGFRPSELLKVLYDTNIIIDVNINTLNT